MKLVILFAVLLSGFTAAAQESKLGFYCVGRHVEQERNRIFFHIILDTASYDRPAKTVKGLVLERIQDGGPYSHVDFDAFYVTPSTVNPQFYIRKSNIQFGDHTLDLEIYPLARNMIGYAYTSLFKDGEYMESHCERADYYDGVWN